MAKSILHVLPSLERRGAQMFARDLIEGLATTGDIEQMMVVLDPGPDEVGMGHSLHRIETLSAKSGVGKTAHLREVFRAHRPDIVFAHGGEPLKYAVLARGLGSSPKIVYRKIGLTEQWLGRHRWLKLPFQRWLLGRADEIAAVGESMRDELIELFHVAPTRIHVIYQGVDPGWFNLSAPTREQVRATLGIAPHAKVLISVGALSWEKNQAAMLRAFSGVHKRFPESILLLVGDGPERNTLEALADKLGLESAVRFLGVRRDVPDLMAAADLLLLTSLTEGVPGVLIEAGMAGLPCVTWDVAGAREVVQDGTTGLVTPYREEDAFAAALIELLTNTKRVEEMGIAARMSCRERFGIDRCVDAHVRLFQTLVPADTLMSAGQGRGSVE